MDEVRAHLVVLRGGAPFLSPKDAALLVTWLEEGKSVSGILTALERAAEARRERASRVPLSLRQAKRYLESRRPIATTAPTVSADHPLTPLAEDLRQIAATDPRPKAVRALATALEALPARDPDRLVRTALVQIRAFLEDCWQALGAAERDRLQDEALDLVLQAGIKGSAAQQNAAQAMARTDLRRRYPQLTAATLWDLVDP